MLKDLAIRVVTFYHCDQVDACKVDNDTLLIVDEIDTVVGYKRCKIEA